MQMTNRDVNKPPNEKSFSFAEIVHGRDSSVRVTDDGLLYAVDLVMVVTGKDRDYAGQVLRSISHDIFHPMKFHERQLSTRGGLKTKLVSFQDAIELVMVLPGHKAKETRTQFAEIIKRYLAGDMSLVSEIETNAESSSPIAQLARLPEDNPRHKRIKREDLELIMLERDVQEKHIKNLQSFMGLMNTIRPDWMQTDTRFRLQTEDMIKNIYGAPSVPAITNEPIQSKTTSLSISQLVQELGGKVLKHADACRAGSLAAKRYRALHHDLDPPKHRQWVDGAERGVNSYTEDDRELLTGVLVDLGLVS